MIRHPSLRTPTLRTSTLRTLTLRTFTLRTVALSFVVTLIGSSGFASDPKPMTAVDLLSLPSIGSGRLSPDGESVVLVKTVADWDGNKRTGHLWLQRGAEEARQITFGESGEGSPGWTPDGEGIVFLAKRGDDEHDQVYHLPIAGGEAQRLFEHDSSPFSLQWSPDGDVLYFLATDPKTEERKKKDKVKDDVIAYDEDYRQRHLWRYEPGTEGGKPSRVTEGDFTVSSYEISRDGEHVVFHRAPTPLFDDSAEGEVWIRPLDGSSEGTRLTTNTVRESGGELSPDGSTVLFLSGSSAEFETYHNGNLFVVPATGGQARLLLEDLPHGIDAASWSADGRSIYFLANTGARSQLFAVAADGSGLEQLTDGDHSLRGWHYRPELGQHLLSVNEPTNGGDYWLYDDGAETFAKRTGMLDWVAESYRLPKVELITWKGEDDVSVEGLLFYPLDYDEDQIYPLVVQTHGGPAASDKFGFGRWGSYTQVLTARGWFVLKPNYRGSTGYGDAFLRDMVGSYFNQSHLDVMKGVDAVIERGLVDGNKMAKMGWSAGGHMTNKIITHTDRFKAASSGAGAINWISMYGQSDVRIYRTPWFGDTPWSPDAPIDNYWKSSPLSEIWKVTTPTIVLVGENDRRVPAAQSVELFRALQSNGVESHLYMAPRAGHGWRELRHQLFKINVELDWFERHVLGREYEWEIAPPDVEAEDEEAEAETETTDLG